jgi:hydroxypyruvate isomerase
MLRFGANLTMLFTEAPFLDRFAAAAQAGFKAVEYLFPYDYEMADIKTRLTENGLQQVLFNLPCGNWAAGERGIASHPERIQEFRDGVKLAAAWAKELGVPRVNCLAGNKLPGLSPADQWRTLADNVRYAADVLGESGLELTVEPINHYDVKDFFLNTSAQALQLLAEAGRPNAYLQYDLYHACREEEDIPAVLQKNIGIIRHIQLADAPGRHQPGTGQMDYASILRLVESLGYQGTVSLEYIPETDTVSSLDWINKLGYKL